MIDRRGCYNTVYVLILQRNRFIIYSTRLSNGHAAALVRSLGQQNNRLNKPNNNPNANTIELLHIGNLYQKIGY